MPDMLKVGFSSEEREFTPEDARAVNKAAMFNMLQEIQEMESRAHGLGCLVTARALNQAKNALGWEMAGDILAAGKASRGGLPYKRKSR